MARSLVTVSTRRSVQTPTQNARTRLSGTGLRQISERSVREDRLLFSAFSAFSAGTPGERDASVVSTYRRVRPIESRRAAASATEPAASRPPGWTAWRPKTRHSAGCRRRRPPRPSARRGRPGTRSSNEVSGQRDASEGWPGTYKQASHLLVVAAGGVVQRRHAVSVLDVRRRSALQQLLHHAGLLPVDRPVKHRPPFIILGTNESVNRYNNTSCSANRIHQPRDDPGTHLHVDVDTARHSRDKFFDVPRACEVEHVLLDLPLLRRPDKMPDSWSEQRQSRSTPPLPRSFRVPYMSTLGILTAPTIVPPSIISSLLACGTVAAAPFATTGAEPPRTSKSSKRSCTSCRYCCLAASWSISPSACQLSLATV